jgi:ataxin-3
MVIVSVSDFNHDGGEGGADGRVLPPHGPGGIYHEKQIGALCAVHALNNLMQGRVYDEYQLAQIAQQLDAQEARLLGGQALDSVGNVRADGFFNVEVLRAALTNDGFAMDRIAGDEAKRLLAQPEKQRGFILNKREHWFALRRIAQEWFDLNSCLKTPRHFTDRELASAVNEAFSEGYTVFVVNGPFQQTELDRDHKRLLEAVQGCGHFRQGHCLFAGSGQTLGATTGATSVGATAAVDPELLAAAQHDPDLAAAIAASLSDQSQAAPAQQPKQDSAEEMRRKRLARFG